jgi:hypothetical protein
MTPFQRNTYYSKFVNDTEARKHKTWLPRVQNFYFTKCVETINLLLMRWQATKLIFEQRRNWLDRHLSVQRERVALAFNTRKANILYWSYLIREKIVSRHTHNLCQILKVLSSLLKLLGCFFYNIFSEFFYASSGVWMSGAWGQICNGPGPKVILREWIDISNNVRSNTFSLSNPLAEFAQPCFPVTYVVDRKR